MQEIVDAINAFILTQPNMQSQGWKDFSGLVANVLDYNIVSKFKL